MSRRFHSGTFHRQVYRHGRHDKKESTVNSRVRCTGCRHYFERDDIHVDLGIGRYCSSECRAEHEAAKRRRRRNKRRSTRPASTSEKTKTRHISMETRAKVRERDRCCRWCAGRGSQIHHVIYRSQGGPDVPENLIFLCLDCHARAHSSKAAYQDLLLMYLWAFYVHGDQWTIPQIASRLRRTGELSDLQLERLYGEIREAS